MEYFNFLKSPSGSVTFIFIQCLIISMSIADKIDPVQLAKGVNGLEKFILHESSGSSAEVYLYGAHVTSWKNKNGEELLFLSKESMFDPPKPIRGGIPICFPQFSNQGPLKSAHGFARNRFWKVDKDPPAFPATSNSTAYIDLILKSSNEDPLWPHSFEFRLRVALGPKGDLLLTSRIRNTNADGKPFSFTFAYHTYFSVSNISEVRVEGLEKLDYLDIVKNKEPFTEERKEITFEAETDRIYLNTPTTITILDREKNRTFMLRKNALPNAVVWNPWDKKAKTIVDLGDDEYKNMLCVEAAAIERPVTLNPGEEWTGREELSTVPSS